jgi:hypothetical protein
MKITKIRMVTKASVVRARLAIAVGSVIMRSFWSQ